MTTRVFGAVDEEMSTKDARRMFGLQVSDRLGMTAEDFLEALDRGDYDDTDNEDIIRLRLLAPFGR